MSAAAFTIKYDGPAVEGGRMAVRDLAPALLAMGEAVNAASRIANPAARPPALAIAATEPGSFLVKLDLVDPGLFEKIQELFTSDPVTAAVNAGDLVGWVIGGIGALKWLHTRRVRRSDGPQPGWVRLTDENGNHIDLPAGQFTLIQDPDFRVAARDLVEPLHEDAIEDVEIKHGDDQVVVEHTERAAFAIPPAGDELVVDQEREAVVRLTSVAFQEGNKWRVVEGGEFHYWVALEDEDFIRRVRDGEQFGAGDTLRVRLHTLQWEGPDGAKSEHTIKQVLEHRRGARQVPLPFADD